MFGLQRTVLDSLSTIRIEKIRIKPIETGAQGRGGKADVIPAELVSAEASGSSHPAVVRHVAVKKLRPDNNTGDPHIRILAVGVIRLRVAVHNAVLTRRELVFSFSRTRRLY